MKKTIITLLAATALLSCTATAQDNTTHFSGQLEGLKGDSLIVFTPEGNNVWHRDTVLISDGKFTFAVTVKQPQTIYVYTPATIRREENMQLPLIAVPGESAVINGSLADGFFYDGSTFYHQYGEIDRAVTEAEQPLNDLMRSFQVRSQAGESRDSIQNEYMAKVPALMKQVRDTTLSLIVSHHDQEAAAAFIPELGELALVRKAVAALDPAVRDGRMKAYYGPTVDRLEGQAKRDSITASKQAAGVEAPDFTLNDLNGKPLTLSSLRGKYVILDFWGTWCVWCVRGIPKMKEYYAKYKDKVEILSIDCGDTEEKWKKGVADNELPWLNVYQPQNAAVQTTDLYAVQGFPTKVLVGPDGKIVRTVMGEDPAFYTMLDEMFGQK